VAESWRSTLVDPDGCSDILPLDDDTGLLTLQEEILLPAGLPAIIIMKRVLRWMVHKQQEGLPEYNDRTTVDYDYEEQAGSLSQVFTFLLLQPSTGDDRGARRQPPPAQEPVLHEMNGVRPIVNLSNYMKNG